MIRKSILLLVAAVLILTSLPAVADTIVPGKYKAVWKSDYEGSCTLFAVGELKPASADSLASIRGLVSKTPLMRREEPAGFVTLLDESLGTGKGYDTLYFVTDWKEGSPLDIAKLPKLHLSSGPGNLVPENTTIRLRLTPAVGERQYGVDVQFTEMDSSVPARPKQVRVELSGELVGEIKTSGKPITFDLMNWGHIVPQTKDTDMFVATLDVPDDPAEEAPFTNMLFDDTRFVFGGQVCVFKVGKSGDEVEITPYPGDTGRVRFEAKDGDNKQLKCVWFGVEDTDSGVRPVGPRELSEMPVPAGKYMGSFALVDCGQTEKGHSTFFSISRKQNLTITKGQTVVVKLGGPVTMRIVPDTTVITVKQGAAQKLGVQLTVGGRNDTLSGEGKPDISITDSKGKVVQHGSAEVDQKSEASGHFQYELSAKDLEPGDYKLTVSYNAWPYQDGVIKLEKTVRVTK